MNRGQLCAQLPCNPPETVKQTKAGQPLRSFGCSGGLWRLRRPASCIPLRVCQALRRSIPKTCWRARGSLRAV